MSHNWEGVFCALWTPTDAAGAPIVSALRNNIALLQQSGVDGLLILGSTGEFPYLTLETRQRVIEQVMGMAERLRVIVNLSDVRWTAVRELAHCAHHVHAPAVALLPPWFFPVAQEDLVEFFSQAGSEAGLPLFLYNFPERTGNRIALETVEAVASRVPVAGVKQSGAEFEYHRPLVELGQRKGFSVFTGADTHLPKAMAMGVKGCVSGLANAVPELVREAYSQARLGAPMDAPVAAKRLSELAGRLSVVNFPLDVAACMQARGLEVGQPKSILSPTTLKRFERLVAELRDLFREWKLA
jgi:dihydrodipicolinate synthase/N-acetylneuraminate lyase